MKRQTMGNVKHWKAWWALDARAVGTRCPSRGDSMLTARGQDAHGAGIQAV